jgi:hypothetical protein
MEVRIDNNSATPLTGIDPVLTEIRKRLHSQPQQWLQTLTNDPAAFADLEKTVHQAFQQMADQLVAGLLAGATQGEPFAKTAKKK